MTWMPLPPRVRIFEVGPRDGLQNEQEFVPTDKKIQLVTRLQEAGCMRIEVTSFVHPKWVPQMSDAETVVAGLARKEAVVYNALVPNTKGLERAVAAGLSEVVTIMSASESHNKANLNMSVAESLAEIQRMAGFAASRGVRVRSYIGTAFGCPMEGKIPPDRVAEIAAELERYGAYEISLGDTTGMADPRSAFEVPLLVKKRLSSAQVAVHYHQAGGIEFANVLASLQAGIDIVDAAAGGLGGCPYAPGAKGNIATEDLVEMLSRLGIQTGIDLEKARACGSFARSLSGYYRSTAHDLY